MNAVSMNAMQCKRSANNTIVTGIRNQMSVRDLLAAGSSAGVGGRGRCKREYQYGTKKSAESDTDFLLCGLFGDEQVGGGFGATLDSNWAAGDALCRWWATWPGNR